MSNPKQYLPSDWMRIIEGDGFLRYLETLYNGNSALVSIKIIRLRKQLQAFKKLFGDVEIIITRAPGRVNLMGRHVDHQGGYFNLVAIDREIFMIASARDDDLVKMHNLDEDHFPQNEFSSRHFLSPEAYSNWSAFLDSDRVRALPKGCWTRYIQAAVLRFQAYYHKHLLKGMNLLVSGDIPIAAGLSSSSALVVATAEATVALNGLNVDDDTFIQLCGEGEWFVGTRGGQADHAAMKMSRSLQVAQVSFYPLCVKQMVPFPENHSILICDSHIKARKSEEVLNTFNQRVACYHLGRHLFKAMYPEYAPEIEHLRDINPWLLRVTLSEFYGLLKKLPEHITRDELDSALTEDVTAPVFAYNPEFRGTYPIREIVLYGIAESARSTHAADLLKEGKIARFGELMKISHDGDRLFSYDDSLSQAAYRFDTSDEYFDRLIVAAEKGEEVPIHEQAGSYRCSTAEIDLIVDITRRIRGVKGVQLSGAGLGGCVIALVEQFAVDNVINQVTDKYYSARNLEPSITVCTPVAGSGILEFTSS